MEGPGDGATPVPATRTVAAAGARRSAVADLTPFSVERLASAFRSASTAASARQRLELLLDGLHRMEGEVGREVDPGLLVELRRRVYDAAACNVRTADAGLLVALLQGTDEHTFQVPGVLARQDLRPALRRFAGEVYARLLDEVEAAGAERRVLLWWVVESLARTVSMPSPVRERVFGFLHTLPREILEAFPDEAPPIRVIRRRPLREFSPVQQRAIEASSVVCALMADPELPAGHLAALVPRALRYCDPVTRRQVAEHPRADSGAWALFLEAPNPVDRALPGRLAATWSHPPLAERLRGLAEDRAIPPPVRSSIRVHLCRAAPLDLARAWLPEVIRHQGVAALDLLSFARPELAIGLDERARDLLASDPGVRSLLGLDLEAGDPGRTRRAEAVLDELQGTPGEGLVRSLLDR
jgi:hypothetical protein